MYWSSDLFPFIAFKKNKWVNLIRGRIQIVLIVSPMRYPQNTFLLDCVEFRYTSIL